MTSVLFHDIQSLPQIIILLLQLEYLGVAVIKAFRLPLNGFSQRQVALKNFFHHINCMDDTLCNGVFRLINSTMGL